MNPLDEELDVVDLDDMVEASTPRHAAKALADVIEELDTMSTAFPDFEMHELLELLEALQLLQKQFGDVVREATDVVANRMTGDKGDYEEGWHSSRERPRTAQWDGAGARKAIIGQCVQRYCVDPLTGEVHKPLEHAVTSALRAAFAAVSSAPKASMTVSGLDALEIDPAEYRSWKDGSWKVTVWQGDQ